jgi:hypothetical protein
VPQWLNSGKMLPFAFHGPIPGGVFTNLGQSAQATSFGSNIDEAMDEWIKEYNNALKLK